VARLRTIAGTRILLSCRTFDFNSDPRLHRTAIQTRFQLPELSDDQVKTTVATINLDYDGLSPATQRLLRVPLHLDLLALAAEGLNSGELAQPDLWGIRSLQDLYGLLWGNVVLKSATRAPAQTDCVEALRFLTEYMNRERTTSVPQVAFAARATRDLEQAVRWLASAGIVIPSATGFGFLHQSFSDYCYARFFVDGGGRLSETILAGDQGLFARRQLVQVLTYLRGSNSRAYLRELQGLAQASDLRFHLHDLLVRWFGAVADPAEDELVVARRFMVDLGYRSELLRAMGGNPAWFRRLNESPIQELLAQEDEVLDLDIIPYLVTMVEVAQSQVINLVRRFLGQTSAWNARLDRVLSSIRTWHTTEAVELFVQMCLSEPRFALEHSHDLSCIAIGYPRVGCELIRVALDRVLDNCLGKRGDDGKSHYLPQDLDSLNGTYFGQALAAASQSEPKYFLESLLPWLQRVTSLAGESSEDWPFFPGDSLSNHWSDDDVFSVHRSLISALVTALTALASDEAANFRSIALQLASIRTQTPQRLLACVYSSLGETHAQDAFTFLLADRRRLSLGEVDENDSRLLIRAIHQYLRPEQRTQLEAAILDFPRVIYTRHTLRHLYDLSASGLEQLHLLQAIPADSLGERAARYRLELERKFPGQFALDSLASTAMVRIPSPIPDQAIGRLSDEHWLRVMNKYQGEVTRGHILGGGADEVAAQLANAVKEDPERFYRLALKTPVAIDSRYAAAFLHGLTDATAPADWLFVVVRYFVNNNVRDIGRSVASALQRRVDDGLPADLLGLLDGYVRGPQNEDEIGWEQAGDPYNRYINSTRGRAMITLMRAFDHSATEEMRQTKWDVVEFVSTDPSAVLRVGAAEELRYMLKEDPPRAIGLFRRLIEGHLQILASHEAYAFLYHALYRDYNQVGDFIVAMMNDVAPDIQQRGAQLACVASILPVVSRSVQIPDDAYQLAQSAVLGPVSWRRGAAEVYAANINTKASAECTQGLKQLLDDEDDQVQRAVSAFVGHLTDAHLRSLRSLLEAYAVSRSLRASMFGFANWLWEHGIIDPAWSLSTIKLILGNIHVANLPRWERGSELLVRLTLRCYTDPTADDRLRTRAMDVFDALMSQYSSQAQRVLAEWDCR
jgi:hypothetical protein